MDNPDHLIYAVSPDVISDKDCEEVREIARRMLESKSYGNDHFKVSLYAMIYWMSLNGIQIEIEPYDSTSDAIH